MRLKRTNGPVAVCQPVLDEMEADGIVEITGYTKDGKAIYDLTEYGRSLDGRSLGAPLKGREA